MNRNVMMLFAELFRGVVEYVENPKPSSLDYLKLVVENVENAMQELQENGSGNVELDRLIDEVFWV